MNLAFVISVCFALGLCFACRDSGHAALPGELAADPPAGAAPAAREAPLIVFLGDSLTAGNGLGESEAFPALIGERLRREGQAVRIVNAGVSGDTSAGGLARLDWILRQHPDVVVVALGANDGLRGLPVDELERNLTAILARAKAAGARTLLAGMMMPPNYGVDYATSFGAVYPRVAQALDVPLVPFLLEGVGGVPALNQADGVHPNAKGQELIAETVLAGLLPLVPSE